MEGLCDIYTFEGFAVHRIVYIHVLSQVCLEILIKFHKRACVS